MRHIFIIYLMKYPSLPLPGTETYLDFNGPRILSYWTTTNVDSWLNFDFQINGHVYYHLENIEYPILHLSFYISTVYTLYKTVNN